MEYQISLLDDDIEQINLLRCLINRYKTVSGISINILSYTSVYQAKIALKSLKKRWKPSF